MSNIDLELNSQLSAWTIQCVIHHDESFVDPLCDLRRLNSGQPGRVGSLAAAACHGLKLPL